MPVRCPVCGHENLAGALICAKCYSMLVNANIFDSTTVFPDFTPPKPPTGSLAKEGAPEAGPKVAPLEPGTVALYIEDNPTPLILQIGRQAILGRYSPRSVSQPRVDLTPYGAFDKGISRLHVTLRRTDTGLVIEDMASSNGTWLNDQRLTPYTPYPLKSGDKLRLSQLEITVQIGGEPH
jgi:pSer/pThr/pTyr-binding forkhead associated (FHA) protein